MAKNNDLLHALRVFLARDQSMKIFDYALLIVLYENSKFRLTTRQCADAFGVQIFTIANAIGRLKRLGFLDDSGQPTAVAVQLLGEAIGKPAPVVKADKREARAVDPGDSRRSSQGFAADQLATPTRAATILGMSKAKFAECELLKGFPTTIRNDSDARITYFYSVGELRNWARAYFNKPY